MNDHIVTGMGSAFASLPEDRIAGSDPIATADRKLASRIIADGWNRRFMLLFIIIVAGYALYATAYIYRTSFVVEGERYFCLFDDAMISMRYAKNLAHGNGLVWNTGGERVEGFTNPLWTLMMAGLHLLPLPLSKMSLLVQIIGAMFLIANAWYVLRLAREVAGPSMFAVAAALILTLSYLPLNNWGLQGMETSLLTLLVTASASHVLTMLKTGRFSSTPYLLLGIGVLVRMDMVVPFIALALFMWWSDPLNSRRHILIPVGIMLAALLALTGLRWWYYGELLPNTYYLKVAGVSPVIRISRGFYVLVRLIMAMTPFVFFVPFLLPVLYRNRSVNILLILFLAQTAYSIYVGGDAWEWWGGSNRYIVIAMPCFFVAMAVVVGRLGDAVLRLVSGVIRLPDMARSIGHVSLVIALVITVNSIYGPKALGELALITPPLHSDLNRWNVRLAGLLGRVTDRQADIAVCGAGVLPYFLDRNTIDILGKCDAYIAHTGSHVEPGLQKFTHYAPGHTKWDYQYSIGRMKPDFVVEIWDDSSDAISVLRPDYLLADYSGYRFYARSDSREIRWDVFAQSLSAPLDSAWWPAHR